MTEAKCYNQNYFENGICLDYFIKKNFIIGKELHALKLDIININSICELILICKSYGWALKNYYSNDTQGNLILYFKIGVIDNE